MLATLTLIPPKGVRSPVLAEALRRYLAEDCEASEDVCIRNVAGVLQVSAWWADRDWCEDLAALAATALPGTRWWVSVRE